MRGLLKGSCGAVQANELHCQECSWALRTGTGAFVDGGTLVGSSQFAQIRSETSEKSGDSLGRERMAKQKIF